LGLVTINGDDVCTAVYMLLICGLATQAVWLGGRLRVNQVTSACEPGDLQWLCHDDVTINIVLAIVVLLLLFLLLFKHQSIALHYIITVLVSV